MSISTLEHVTQALHRSLSVLEPFNHCALLDYPAHPNIGDHLIWLGNLFYITDVMKAKIEYTSSMSDFSASTLERQMPQGPIILHGGGNLGDLWPMYQKFREQIILKYKNRAIFILPQSIYFSKKENLEKASDLFNSHPNLTLFVREDNSYNIAIEHFQNCHIIKAPDMAFQMVNMPNLSFPLASDSSILYLYREDIERDKTFSPASLGIPNLIVEDWISYTWMSKIPKDWVYIPGLVKLIREGWQRGLATPQEWMSRQIWEKFHPYAYKFHSIYNPALHHKSWSLMHSGMYQLKRHRLIITNRLHVHILCLILGIPHVLLPGSYYKIESFYKTWTHQLPLCRFVKEPSQVKGAVEELLNG